MRRLHVNSFEFTEFHEAVLPPYAIASHRWQEEEITFQDVKGRRNTHKRGYKKVESFARYVRERIQSVEWLWIDTCCINKDSAAELSEAINLMFKWYRNAKVCLAFLVDVDTVYKKSNFIKSEWFERGWTLQELLAPRTVVFITKSWQVLGDKGAPAHAYSGTFVGEGLEKEIATRTGIPEPVLHDYNASSGLTVDARFKWMEGRKTTREEDMSYALYGIFGVTPGANYGEERKGARERLLAAIHQQKTRAAQQAEQFRKITDWLSSPHPWTNHNSARQRHEPQTGTWLLDRDEYRQWKLASLRHLWLCGKVGCGKTVLCSTAIEDVRRHCENAANAGYAVFFLSFSDVQKQRYEDALLSWVTQLGWREPAFSMLQQAYERPSQEKPRQDELEKILLACVETYDEVFILIDALDECPEDGDVRVYMMQCLARLSHIAPKVKIFATSRELPDIRESMMTLGAQPVLMESQVVDADIRKYMATQLSRDHRLSRLDLATKALIESAISEKADGMFRWAYCQLQELKKLKSTRPKTVQNALHSLSKTLDETYERMLTSIEESLQRDALTLLRWLAYAKSPVGLSELVDAAIIDWEGEGSLELDNKPGLGDTLEILSGLVTTASPQDYQGGHALFDNHGTERTWQQSADDGLETTEDHQQIKSDTIVKLAHFSVKEYLESKRILEGNARTFHLESTREHGLLAQSCLIYLMYYSDCEKKLSSRQDLATFPLLRYAAESWFHHSAQWDLAEASHEANILRDEARLTDWLQVHQPDRSWRFAFDSLDDIGSSLYYASFIGSAQAVCELLSTNADVNTQGGHYGNALQAASYQGHEKVVQLVIGAGADVNAKGGYYGNALQAASERGHEKVVQLLIDHRVDVNAHGRRSNALQGASSIGHEMLVQMLMNAGADVNAQGGHCGSALQAASLQGSEKVVQMLIDAGADFKAQGGYYDNALQAASERGHVKVVQMLMDAGADAKT